MKNGMLSYENDAFKFSKTAKTTNSMCIMCTIVPGSWNCLFSPNQSAVDQKHERKSSHRVVLYIFQNIKNFDTGNFSLTQSIISEYQQILNLSAELLNMSRNRR